VALVALGACSAAPLPELGVVPPFSMTERSGRPIGRQDLAGSVWIANFVFTRCPDVCPVLTARMRDVQKALDGTMPPIQLVSFTVDPGHDTPEVLARYAAGHGAAPGWSFVTGPRDATASLLRDGFKVAFADDGPEVGPITHSDRFVLVDPQLRIRGYYHGNDPQDLERLARDARRLAADSGS
jgi:protein SCO1/2